MLKAYRTAAPTKFLQDANDQEYIEKFIGHLLVGAGFVFLAIKDEQTVGMIMAARHTNVWNPAVTQISELAFWIDKQHRGGRMAHRLLHAYIEHCEQLKQQNNIQFFTLSKMSNSPDLSYDRFGFEKLEETWIK